MLLGRESGSWWGSLATVSNMKSTAERIESLGLGSSLSQGFLFDWRQRSAVLNFLTEKCVTDKLLSGMMSIFFGVCLALGCFHLEYKACSTADL